LRTISFAKVGRLGRGLADLDPGGFEGCLLGAGSAGRSGDDSPGVSHGLALRGGEPGHICDHGFGDVGQDVVGGAFLGVPTDFPIMTMASVSGSSSKAWMQSMCVVPMTGSPPMPTQVEKPMSRSSYIIW